MRSFTEVKVINPIPWFPFCSRLDRYRGHNRVPYREVLEGIEVYHPRFLFIPRILKVLESLTYCFAALPLAIRIRKSWKYDLVDLQWTYPDLPASRLLVWLLRLKQVITIRGQKALHLDEWGLRGRIVKRLLARSDHVIALSHRLKALCTSMGVAEDRISVVGNGVDRSQFHPMDRDACRERVGLSASGRKILAVGTVTHVKGFDRLIECFPQILKQHPDVELHILGPGGAFAGGDEREALRGLVGRLRLERSVHFVGEVPNDELVFWYNAADCFCLSSRSEGSPNVLLEALACGCPAVATDVGSVPDILTDPEMGAIVANSKEGLLEGLLSVLSSPCDREAIASSMRRHGWEHCAGEIVKIYKRLLGHPVDAPGQDETSIERAHCA
ncbi:MAG: glycosyltransferase [Pirellulales bacterium]|nr:glycosyltransferase [Pirellulales bacterium]